MAEEFRNPCSYKVICRGCRIVSKENRPVLCERMKCQDYIPCKKCLNNKPLGDDGMCDVCSGRSESKSVIKNVAAEKAARKAGMQTVIGVDAVKRSVGLSRPGVPPEDLNEEEKEYYMERWLEYKGYYRDPASYFAVHSMVLEEIHQNHIHKELIRCRGTASETWQKAKQMSILMLKQLKDQLPEKESTELNEDQTSLAGIYEAYEIERNSRAAGPVSRVLTAGAEALASVLPHKVNVRTLMQKLGYEELSIEEAIEKYDIELGATADEFLKNIGFKLKEKYALQFNNPNVDEDISDGMNELDLLQ